MRSFISTAAAAVAASSLVSAAPAWSGSKPSIVQLPLGDGFPTPSTAQLQAIEKAAFGQLSNGAPPKSLTADTATSVELIDLNEQFESFYFANFLKQLDNPEFLSTIKELDVTEQQLREGIMSILAVEELHAINAQNALTKVIKEGPINPCDFIFPVTDVKSAVVLANRFTDVVMGVLQDVIQDAATAGDAGFTPGVASAAEDEGEQNGGFRTWLHQRAQSQPFATRAARELGFSLLQDFIVPGSCKNEDVTIDLDVIQPITVADPSAMSQDISIQFNLTQPRKNNFNPSTQNEFLAKPKPTSECPGLTVTYVNGLSIFTEPVKNCHFNGEVLDVTAYFPQEEDDIFGLVLIFLTDGSNFTSVGEVVDAAKVFGGFAAAEVQEKPLF